MKLKVKSSEWSASLPVVMVNRKTAEKLGAHAGDRVVIKTISKKKKEVVTILDLTTRNVDEKHLLVSTETRKLLGLKENQIVDIAFSKDPKSLELIKKKIKGRELKAEEIKEIISDVVNNSLSEPEIAAFISAMYRNEMTFKETVSLINAILESGKVLKFKNRYVVDKHCIGGIAGNRTTPLIVSICAAEGLTFPKTSSRAITSAAGTADCVESIAQVEFSMDEVKKIVQKTGACLTWGGSLGMVPADSKIIKVEKMLKIDPTAQLLASIMSKKLAAGSKYILIDIPYGKGAKVTKSKGMFLKKKFEALGKYFKVKLKVILTRADQPIGNGVGPMLEMIDIIDILDPTQKGPRDLEDKSIFLAGLIFEMTGKAKKGKGEILAKEILWSGKAFKKFKQIIRAQNGSLKKIKLGKFSEDIKSTKVGKIKGIQNKLINEMARTAGCPNDKGAGLFIHKHLGEEVNKDEPILTIYAESKPRLEEAKKFFNEHKPILV